MSVIRKLFRDSKGATAIEYGLIAALISIAALGAMTAIGPKLTNKFTAVSVALN